MSNLNCMLKHRTPILNPKPQAPNFGRVPKSSAAQALRSNLSKSTRDREESTGFLLRDLI